MEAVLSRTRRLSPSWGLQPNTATPSHQRPGLTGAPSPRPDGQASGSRPLPLSHRPPVRPRSPPPPPSPALSPHPSPRLRPDEEARLLSNLITRMAVKTESTAAPASPLSSIRAPAAPPSPARSPRRMGLPPGPSILVHGLTARRTDPTVKIARLSFGGQRFNDIYAGVYPREVLGADGLMGLDVLSRFELEFDLERRSVSVTPSDRIGFGTAFTIPSRLTRNSCGRTRDRPLRPADPDQCARGRRPGRLLHRQRGPVFHRQHSPAPRHLLRRRPGRRNACWCPSMASRARPSWPSMPTSASCHRDAAAGTDLPAVRRPARLRNAGTEPAPRPAGGRRHPLSLPAGVAGLGRSRMEFGPLRRAAATMTRR
jgi:hypothetical protein